MSRDAPAGTAIVAGHDPIHVARVEAALRDLAGWRVIVTRPRQLAEVAHEHPHAVVVIVVADAGSRRTLRASPGWPRGLPIVALSTDAAGLWRPAFRALGLRAALPLDATARELAAAVRAVHAGLAVVHPEALAPPTVREARVTAGAPLSAREREILELMADGAHNRVIAARLGISRHTAKFHVTSILTKLGAASRTEAVALALRGGLLAV